MLLCNNETGTVLRKERKERITVKKVILSLVLLLLHILYLLRLLITTEYGYYRIVHMDISLLDMIQLLLWRYLRS